MIAASTPIDTTADSARRPPVALRIRSNIGQVTTTATTANRIGLRNGENNTRTAIVDRPSAPKNHESFVLRDQGSRVGRSSSSGAAVFTGVAGASCGDGA